MCARGVLRYSALVKWVGSPLGKQKMSSDVILSSLRCLLLQPERLRPLAFPQIFKYLCAARLPASRPK
jgi:hypothetical protein